MALDTVVEDPARNESLLCDVVDDDLTDVDDAIPSDVGKSACKC